MKIKTSKRTHVWVVQKKVKGKWNTIVDEQGPIIVMTRKLARTVSREFKNLSKTPRNYRVRKLA